MYFIQQAKKDRQSKKHQESSDEEENAYAGNTGFSEEEENGDWESNSDDNSDDEDKLESTQIKTTKATEDDVISGELEGLKETAELYKSNIFKLEVNVYKTIIPGTLTDLLVQIDELLTEVTVNYEKHKALEKALHNLKAIFDSIPDGKQLKVNSKRY